MGRDYEREDTSVSSKLTYLIIGGGIGAVIALLFAPKSGKELRDDIADASRKGLEKGKEAASPGMISFTSTVPVEVPSVFHSSRLFDSPAARK